MDVSRPNRSSHADITLDASDVANVTHEHTAEEIADADFRAVANPSNTIVLPQNPTRGEVIQHLSRTIPQNEYGLPLYYLRSDMLDWSKIESYGHLSYDEVEVAAETIAYEEGYPTQKTGSPWWVQLKHEPHSSYLLFKAYLELAELEGIRLLDTLAAQESLELQNLRELALEYYWSARARAYDLFIVAAEARKREVRTRKTEDTHFSLASGIIDTIIGRINDEPELISKMDATDLFDLFEKMVKVQRLSLGLTGQNASTNNALPMQPGASVEFILRSLTKNAGLTDEAQGNFQDRLALLMGDHDTAMTMQELVIRATTDNRTPTHNPPLLPRGGDGAA